MIKFTDITPGTTQLIANGESIEITKITMMSFFGVGNATFTEADGTTIIFIAKPHTVSGQDPTTELTTNWLAHKGLSVTTTPVTYCTVWYSHGAA